MGIIPRNIRKVRTLPTLCRLYVCKVPQEAMNNQSQTPRRVNKETLGGQTRGHELNWSNGIYPTRYYPPSHWGSNPLEILGSHCICGQILWLVLCSTHEGNLSWVNPSVQGSLRTLVIHPQGQGLRLKGGHRKVHIYPVQGGSTNLQTKDKLLLGGISPPKHNCWAQDQGIDPSYPDPPPPCHHNLVKVCEYHDVTLLLQVRVTEAQHPGYGRGRKEAGLYNFWCGVPNLSRRLP